MTLALTFILLISVTYAITLVPHDSIKDALIFVAIVLTAIIIVEGISLLLSL